MGLDWNFNGTQSVDDVLATLKGGVVSAPPKKAGVLLLLHLLLLP